MARARDGGGPSLIHVELHRYFGHFEGDAMTYCGPGEVERLREERDCLKIFRKRVTEAGLLETSQLDEIDDQVATLLMTTPRWRPKRPTPPGRTTC